MLFNKQTKNPFIRNQSLKNMINEPGPYSSVRIVIEGGNKDHLSNYAFF